jgi:hypothetical protein
MSTQKSVKRKRGKGPMIVGEGELAPIVTPKNIIITKKDGSLVSAEVWEPLHRPSQLPAKDDNSNSNAIPQMDYVPESFPSPTPEHAKTYSVRLE